MGVRYNRVSVLDLEQWNFSQEAELRGTDCVLWVTDTHNLIDNLPASYNLALGLARTSWLWILEGRDSQFQPGGGSLVRTQIKYDAYLMSQLPRVVVHTPDIGSQQGRMDTAFESIIAELCSGEDRLYQTKWVSLRNATRLRLESRPWTFGWLEFESCIRWAIWQFLRVEHCTDISIWIDKWIEQNPPGKDHADELPMVLAGIYPLEQEIYYWLLRTIIAGRGSYEAITALTGLEMGEFKTLVRKHQIRVFAKHVLNKYHHFGNRKMILGMLKDYLKNEKINEVEEVEKTEEDS